MLIKFSHLPVHEERVRDVCEEGPDGTNEQRLPDVYHAAAGRDANEAAKDAVDRSQHLDLAGLDWQVQA